MRADRSAPDGFGPVTIGAREIYDALMRLTATVDRMAEQVSDVRGEVADHEQRVRTLERARWPLPSLAAIMAAASLAVAWIRPGGK